MYTLKWLVLRMGVGHGEEEFRYDVPDFHGFAGGPNGPNPGLIAAVVVLISAML